MNRWGAILSLLIRPGAKTRTSEFCRLGFDEESLADEVVT